MRASAQVKNPDSIEIQMSITMPMGEWRKLKDQIKGIGSYPSWQLHNKIVDLVIQAEKTFYTTDPTAQ